MKNSRVIVLAATMILLLGIISVSSITMLDVSAGPGPGPGGGGTNTPVPDPTEIPTQITTPTLIPPPTPQATPLPAGTFSEETWGLYFTCPYSASYAEECAAELLYATGGRWENLMIWNYNELDVVPEDKEPWFNIWMRDDDYGLNFPDGVYGQNVIDALYSYVLHHPFGKIHLGNEPATDFGPGAGRVSPEDYAEWAHAWVVALKGMGGMEWTWFPTISFAGMTPGQDSESDWYAPTYMSAVKVADVIEWRDDNLPDAKIMSSEFGMPYDQGDQATLDNMDYWEGIFEDYEDDLDGPFLWFAYHNHSTTYAWAYLSCPDSTPNDPTFNEPLYNKFRCYTSGDCPPDLTGSSCPQY